MKLTSFFYDDDFKLWTMSWFRNEGPHTIAQNWVKFLLSFPVIISQENFSIYFTEVAFMLSEQQLQGWGSGEQWLILIEVPGLWA